MTYRVTFFGVIVEEGDNRDGRFRYVYERQEFDNIESLRTAHLSVIFLVALLQAVLVGFGVNTFWWLASRRRAE